MASSATLRVRERIDAASTRIGRVKRIDRVARWLIIAGGISIIIGVLFIFLFIAAETLPLFRPAKALWLSTLTLDAAQAPAAQARRSQRIPHPASGRGSASPIHRSCLRHRR